jgi:hypothetical protein
LSENPDALSNEELYRRAYALVQQKQTEARTAAVERLNARLSSGKATTRPEEIVKAARYARIDALFLSGDEHLWEYLTRREIGSSLMAALPGKISIFSTTRP